MMYKKVMASALLWAALTASAGAFDYNQSVDEIAESPLTAYQTVYLGMPRADFDANFSILPDWTFYGSSVSFTERAERTSVVKNVAYSVLHFHLCQFLLCHNIYSFRFCTVHEQYVQFAADVA